MRVVSDGRLEGLPPARATTRRGPDEGGNAGVVDCSGGLAAAVELPVEVVAGADAEAAEELCSSICIWRMASDGVAPGPLSRPPGIGFMKLFPELVREE